MRPEAFLMVMAAGIVASSGATSGQDARPAAAPSGSMPASLPSAPFGHTAVPIRPAGAASTTASASPTGTMSLPAVSAIARSLWELSPMPVDVRASDLSDPAYLTGATRAYWTARVTEAGRIAAAEAARRDALRRLGLRVGAIPVARRMVLGDFLEASDRKDVDLSDFLPAARPDGVLYYPDCPVAEVRVQVAVRSVCAAVNTWARSHFRGSPLDLARLEERIVTCGDEVLVQSGLGAAPAQAMKAASARDLAFIELAAKAPPWFGGSARTALPAGPESSPAETAATGPAEAAREELGRQLARLVWADGKTVSDLLAGDADARRDFRAYLATARVETAAQAGTRTGPAEHWLVIDLAPLWRIAASAVAAKATGPIATSSAPASQPATRPDVGRAP